MTHLRRNAGRELALTVTQRQSCFEIGQRGGSYSFGVSAIGPVRNSISAAAVSERDASDHAFSSASLRACASSVARRARASAAWGPAPKFSRYVLNAVTDPAANASAQAFASVCLFASCPDGACCWIDDCSWSDFWLQPERRTAPATSPTVTIFRGRTPYQIKKAKRFGFERKDSTDIDPAAVLAPLRNVRSRPNFYDRAK